MMLQEGPEGVKWELGFVYFCAGKMGFHALGLGFSHWEWERESPKWEWDSFSPLIEKHKRHKGHTSY